MLRLCEQSSSGCEGVLAASCDEMDSVVRLEMFVRRIVVVAGIADDRFDFDLGSNVEQARKERFAEHSRLVRLACIAEVKVSIRPVDIDEASQRIAANRPCDPHGLCVRYTDIVSIRAAVDLESGFGRPPPETPFEVVVELAVDLRRALRCPRRYKRTVDGHVAADRQSPPPVPGSNVPERNLDVRGQALRDP